MKRDHLGLLYDVSELSRMLAGSADIDAFLDAIVGLLTEHFDTEVASVYLYDESDQVLTLRATRGLRADSVGAVRLGIGEGLVGLSLKELRPICEGCASRHPAFKPVPGIDEELYNAFLAMPIQRGVERIGVLVMQREERRRFGKDDVAAFHVVASQLAGAIENARALMLLHGASCPLPAAGVPTVSDSSMVLLKGNTGSPGFARGPALVIDSARDHSRLARQDFPEGLTQADFGRAVEQTAAQLRALEARLDERLPEMASLIFDAHRMFLKDPDFVGAMETRIAAGESPPEAVLTVAEQCLGFFAESPHAYLREKVDDIKDLARRLVSNLIGGAGELGVAAPHSVVVAREIYPSDILKFSSEEVAGLVLMTGGTTSHVSILARSLGLPLLIVRDAKILAIPNGTALIVDAEVGNLYIRPEAGVVEQFVERERDRERLQPAAAQMAPETRTADGTRIELMANINLLSELTLAADLKAEGVGLYRSEFPFLIRSTFPSEEEQLCVYKDLFAAFPGKPVTIRTLDVGGDKVLAYYDAAGEENPALGLRSIRFSLAHPEVFRPQLRAILRASIGAAAPRILLPMITSLDEYRAARAFILEAVGELEGQSIEMPSIGIMVEVPSLLEVLADLAQEVDFFSIGTNDFIQYLLAVDRTNEKVASLYVPYHPAVLRALARLVWTAREAGRPVSVCGEMAHELRCIPFLIGIGVRTLSVDPRHLPAVQRTVQGLTLPEAEEEARLLLACRTVAEVEAVLARD